MFQLDMLFLCKQSIRLTLLKLALLEFKKSVTAIEMMSRLMKMFCFFLVILIKDAYSFVSSCDDAFGLSDGRINDLQITATSSVGLYLPSNARLNGNSSWCGLSKYNQYIQVNFSQSMKLTKIGFQGIRERKNELFAQSFSVHYRDSSDYWHQDDAVYQTGLTNPDSTSYASLMIFNELTAVRILPRKWKGDMPCLKMELYGCKASKDFCEERKLLNDTCEHKCTNGWTRSICQCTPGYDIMPDRKHCADINECEFGIDVCDVGTTNCVNLNGTYTCECNHPGLKKEHNYSKNCIDIDECHDENGGCSQICKNTKKSYKCLCHNGYELGNDTKTCVDIDECTRGLYVVCDTNTTTCNNIEGRYNCKCLTGLQRETFEKCKDINECADYNGGCDGTCTNTYRSYYCTCPNGTTINPDRHRCDDIDECKTNKTECTQECQNTYTSYRCYCRSGFTLQTDGKSCVDINECQTASSGGKGPCQYNCTNTYGSFECSCPIGYELKDDKRICQDINECEKGMDVCDNATSRCINTQGSFECRCLSGYVMDTNGVCVARKCPELTPAANGYLEPPTCTIAQSHQYHDICRFKCDAGFELSATSSKVAQCNADGNWELQGGYQPICQRIHCTRIQSISEAIIIPSVCTSKGVQYGGKCEMYCNNGYFVKGRNSITCQIDGSYDGDFNNTKCIRKETISCPSDVKLILSIGKSETVLPLIRLDKNLDVTKYITSPPGVLTGHYKFSSKITSQAVKLMLKDYPQEACTFYVKVEDREPPSFTNCPDANIFVSLSDSNMHVVWPEPKFTDNVGVSKVIQNMKPNHVLPQQVYYVFYSARDEFGNEATCRFFVHVKVRACSKANVPGGERGTMIWFGGGNQLSLFLQCQQSMTTFSANVSTAPIFLCSNGVWQSVPDCVGYSDKNGSCPEGQVTVYSKILTTEKCANCPKGTKWTTAGCEKCPIGTYQDSEGQESCLPCQTGTTSVETGLKSVSGCLAQCTPGAYSANGFYGSTGCERCPEGSYQDLYGQKSCKLCPEGGKSDLGSKSEDECYLPARISSILPSQEVITAKTGDTVVIKCYGTGNPAPFMLIQSVKPLPPDSFRGKVLLTPLVVANKYISGIQLTITNVQAHYDSQVYKCTADNKRGSNGNLDEQDFHIVVE